MLTIPKLVQDSAGFPVDLPCWDTPRQSAIPHKAVIYCPSGHVGFLRHHTIAKDGTVSPLCICSRIGCTFKELLRLQGWNP